MYTVVYILRRINNTATIHRGNGCINNKQTKAKSAFFLKDHKKKVKVKTRSEGWKPYVYNSLSCSCHHKHKVEMERGWRENNEDNISFVPLGHMIMMAMTMCPFYLLSVDTCVLFLEALLSISLPSYFFSRESWPLQFPTQKRSKRGNYFVFHLRNFIGSTNAL